MLVCIVLDKEFNLKLVKPFIMIYGLVKLILFVLKFLKIQYPVLFAAVICQKILSWIRRFVNVENTNKFALFLFIIK